MLSKIIIPIPTLKIPAKAVVADSAWRYRRNRSRVILSAALAMSIPKIDPRPNRAMNIIPCPKEGTVAKVSRASAALPASPCRRPVANER